MKDNGTPCVPVESKAAQHIEIGANYGLHVENVTHGSTESSAVSKAREYAGAKGAAGEAHHAPMHSLPTTNNFYKNARQIEEDAHVIPSKMGYF